LVRVGTVDEGVRRILAGGEDGVEGGNFGVDVGDVVEEGAVRVLMACSVRMAPTCLEDPRPLQRKTY